MDLYILMKAYNTKFHKNYFIQSDTAAYTVYERIGNTEKKIDIISLRNVSRPATTLLLSHLCLRAHYVSQIFFSRRTIDGSPRLCLLLVPYRRSILSSDFRARADKVTNKMNTSSQILNWGINLCRFRYSFTHNLR